MNIYSNKQKLKQKPILCPISKNVTVTKFNIYKLQSGAHLCIQNGYLQDTNKKETNVYHFVIKKKYVHAIIIIAALNFYGNLNKKY